MMKNKKVEANLSMVVSKTFSGLNMNALKYLLPVWVSPLSGVTLRCVFAAIAFWIIGMFVLCWLISALNYYIRGYDQLPANA